MIPAMRTFRRLSRLARLVSAAGAMVSGAVATASAATAQTVGTLPPQGLAANCTPGGGNPFGAGDMEANFFVDYCRAHEGVGPIVLPSNYESLTVPEQLLVAIDLERVNRGEDPVIGLSAALDTNAQQGADADTDPTGGASIWAAGDSSALGADYWWMYDDGYGSGNESCTTPGEWGCWGHRNNILESDAAGPLVGGGGYQTGVGQWGTSYTFVFNLAAQYTDVVFTWAQELAYFSTPPAEEPLAPAVVTDVSPATGSTEGGTEVTVTGSNLASTTAFYFDTVAGTDVLCSSDTTCTVTAPPGPVGSVAVVATNATRVPGTSTAQGKFSYAPPTLTAVSGSGQSAAAGSRFASSLVAEVELTGVPMGQVPVTFTVAGGSASFPSGEGSATVSTSATGQATAPSLRAGGSAGLVTVTASTPGSAATVSFQLTVDPLSADLQVIMVASQHVTHSGWSFGVTVSAHNFGPDSAQGVSLTVEVPSQVKVMDAPGASRQGRLLDWPIANLKSGGGAPRVITLRVPGSARRGQLEFTATVRSETSDPHPRNDTALVLVRVGSALAS